MITAKSRTIVSEIKADEPLGDRIWGSEEVIVVALVWFTGILRKNG